jgi:Skp family chaperone for outer membrane proteins
MKKILSTLIGLALLGMAMTGFIFRQDIQDWAELRNYQPSAEIAALASDTTMSEKGRALFYLQDPLLVDKVTFNEYCRINEATIVLGCYIEGRGIYLLDVTDDRLKGVEEVTAAHEMLHAAYDRLGNKEKDRINKLLLEVFDNVTNDRLRQTIELYRTQDPAIVPNELHSILGTELQELPVELETYYSAYFIDRSKVVELSERYEQVFIERKNTIRAYDEDLKKRKAEIDALQSQLITEEQDIIATRNQLNTYRANNDIATYNKLIPSYNKKVATYNNDIKILESLVATYNDIVQKRNDVAEEEAALVEAIDSREVVPSEQ